MGNEFYKFDRHNEAEFHYQQVVRDLPSDVTTYHQLGICIEAIGEQKHQLYDCDFYDCVALMNSHSQGITKALFKSTKKHSSFLLQG